MDWLDGLFVLTSVAWLYEIWRYRNRSEPTDGASEHASFYIVSLMMVTVFAISIGLSVWTDTRQATLQRLLGLSGFIAGVSLRYWGIRQLRHQFTRHVVVRPADELVSSGPYRYLRHPLYTGLLFITFGFSLFFAPWTIALVGTCLMSLALLWRIHIEEKMLTSHFGVTYERWAKSRKRLIPFIY
ncbi:isoprenylcysteine carboxylmethyltransferase family protein [Exiguobacterium sp. AM39-5BH]|uniref:methyltransferase family protein n=1 Tax=Exiguobacterium sp. AM39-5BH TaxID=2292355 RepID=UPI000FE22D5E|nr:isoprenylcysteine carboxylmethyltransferase family protein [Exiguobacterium sp. AM39-5BH]RHB46917.1 isoprenylcysteine carboxylmethyltransferase family protein [Exiguobacterium sp. AM39-5BH]